MRASRALVLLAGWSLVAQAQPFPSDRIRYETERAIVFFEAGTLPPERMQRFARLLDTGIADIEAYLHVAVPAQTRPEDPGKITYYVSSRIEMSRAFRRTVLLPMERVQADTAPYLHETTHVLMPVRNGSVWLSEGFASYVQSYVAEHMGGYDGYVFSRGGNSNVDRLAKRYLSSERGRGVLPYVGADGQPPEMESERWRVAAPFYVFSHSFSKFLVERAGLDKVKALLAVSDPAASCERTTGRAVAFWKADWLASIEAGALSSSQ